MKLNTASRITLKLVTSFTILASCTAVGYIFGSEKALLREANSRAILCTEIANAIRSGRTDVALKALELMASGSVSAAKDYQGFHGASRLTQILFTAHLDERDGCSFAAEYLGQHEEAAFEPEAARYLRAHYPDSFATRK